MIKDRFIFPFLLANTVMVAAYIDDSMMRKYSTSYDPATLWSPTTSSGSFRPKTMPKVVSRPNTRVVPISPTTITKIDDNDNYDNRNKDEFTKLPSASVSRFDVDEIIRAEYDAWAFRYGKAKEDGRFEIFRSNFLKQMDFNLKTGKFFLLNEYGDMTSEEYEAKMLLLSSMSNDNSVIAFENKLETLDEENLNAVLNQVICDNDKERVDVDVDLVSSLQSTWSDYSFAMDVEEEDNAGLNHGDKIMIGMMMESTDNDDDSIKHDDDDVVKYPIRPLEDAPVAETHRIFSLGSTVSRVASPEVQVSRISRSSTITNRNTSTPIRWPTTKNGRFGSTVTSMFGTVAPMGSSVGMKKNILE
jgi:hypothetical protein